jgi:ABC-type multidrug transport system fused ATPase/permease subunit
VWWLLTHAQRRKAALLLGAMLVGTVLETAGIALITPVLGLMSQSGGGGRSARIEQWLLARTHLSQAQLLAAAMVALVGVYALKAVYLAALAWWQSRFIFGLQLSLSTRLFAIYLRQPYEFHLQRNSAQMIRNVVSETSQFSHLAVIPAVTLLAELLVVAGIAVLLLVIEPLGAACVGLTIGLAGYAFHRLTRMRLLRWGRAREYHEGLRIQHLQQGLGGVKDVKLLGREAQFLSNYVAQDAGVVRVQERQLTLQQLPRLWLELLAVVGLAGLVLTMLGRDRPLDALLPTLGLFAAAAFRLMPSVTKVLTAVQSLRFAEPVLATLCEEISLAETATEPGDSVALPLRDCLTIESLRFVYPGTESAALEGIDLRIPAGTSVGVVGGSGAGKSTFIDLVLGLLTPQAGVISVDGTDIQSNLRGWQQQIGYVPQSIYLTDDSIRANVGFGLPPEQIDDSRVWQALRAAQLEEFVRGLPEGLDTLVGERGVRLSGGQRQRIGIARALYHDPGVLVLDEATSALDTVTERDVMRAVEALHGKKTVLIVAHRTSTVENCDMIVRLTRGRIAVHGSPQAVLAADPLPAAPQAHSL